MNQNQRHPHLPRPARAVLLAVLSLAVIVMLPTKVRRPAMSSKPTLSMASHAVWTRWLRRRHNRCQLHAELQRFSNERDREVTFRRLR